MLNLQWNKTVVTAVNRKVAVLAERFYLTIEADLADIIDQEFLRNTLNTKLYYNQTAAE